MSLILPAWRFTSGWPVTLARPCPLSSHYSAPNPLATLFTAPGFLMLLWCSLMLTGCDLGQCHARQVDPGVSTGEILTRGPVHEAFAGVVAFDPQPGLIIPTAPPAPIEELPPGERPRGGNVNWIPGYWGWDDERGDFLWISGIWRDLPPGHQWISGYWADSGNGFQWISGYWAEASAREVIYLPAPPLTVESGPAVPAPSADYNWTPGSWLWVGNRYAWRPGYWALGRADWDWMPAHYVWTPRGHVFVGGYWDHSLERRGFLFAPVYFAPGHHPRRGSPFTPGIVINLGAFTDHLFVRRAYGHYYFGDYFAGSYAGHGYVTSFSFNIGFHGFDPFYSHQRWTHRKDFGWEKRFADSYHHRREQENSRPARTWADLKRQPPTTGVSGRRAAPIAGPMNQVVGVGGSPVRVQPVAREEKQRLERRSQQVQESRDQRRTLEQAGGAGGRGIAVQPLQPTRVQIPVSPIVARPVRSISGNPAPPRSQQAPPPEVGRGPGSGTGGRGPNMERDNPSFKPRPSDTERRTPREREGAGRP